MHKASSDQQHHSTVTLTLLLVDQWMNMTCGKNGSIEQFSTPSLWQSSVDCLNADVPWHGRGSMFYVRMCSPYTSTYCHIFQCKTVAMQVLVH